MNQWLIQLVLPEWRAHPWRLAVAVLSVALGVALAFSVQLINRSALDEFSNAARAAAGEPDLSLRSPALDGFDDAWFERVALSPLVQAASPVLEVDAAALDAAGQRVSLKLLGVDALRVAPLAASLMPVPMKGAALTAFLEPDAVFLNPAALKRLGLQPGAELALQQGLERRAFRVLGTVTAGGAPLAVMDIAAAQARFAPGRLSRVDIRLAAGADAAALRRALALPGDLQLAEPGTAAQRVSDLSRAYRVNLTVLALVALFVGGFLVFSVLALSVSQRTPQLALLGVLGLSPAQRRRLVLAESAAIGVLGSGIGLALGTALAALALRWLAGDLGGGYFPGIAPPLRFSVPAALVFGALGVVAALAGGWWPAQLAARMAPAQALKGLGGTLAPAPAWRAPALLALGGLLALLPPVLDLPLPAYASVACLLLGGIAIVPAAVTLLLARLKPRGALALLAVQRARHEQHAAAVAMAGVVSSLSLAVALTVMVASFRNGVAQWLDAVLPADLYVRGGTQGQGDTAFLPPGFVAAAARVEGVARVEGIRARPLQLDPARPAVTLVARPIADPARDLPLLGRPIAAPPGDALPAVYVSEAMVDLYGARPGTELRLPLGTGAPVAVRVLGVWRDYARQFGAVALDDAAYRRLTGDARVNDLALWLAPDAALDSVQQRLRALVPDAGLLEFAQPGEIRRISLGIFDRSFAVTYYLQAVAIGIGLFGIAASFSAQVMARRREFGLLAHLGFTRRQVVGVVGGEGAAWTAAGALVGLGLGILVSVVLVKVVNPQSFHWTMELLLPWARLGLLCAAVVAAGTLTAALSARAAAGRDAVLAVKEDW
ncbi:FtsX-like permease family protein [Azohydromonas aeria]|uniref:FtsX-like permease family protein n=1 Tax=Azohydromonas aeria TaxID=2590212 RepID=UPI0012FC4C6C|nr:ABC transporter permease [Azohydromonas aeria]